MKNIFRSICLIAILLVSSFSLIACGETTETQVNSLDITSISQDYNGNLVMELSGDEILDSSVGKYMEVSINGGEWNSSVYFDSQIGKYFLIAYSNAETLDYIGQTITIDIRISEYTNNKVTYLASPGLETPYVYTVKECLTNTDSLDYIGVINENERQYYMINSVDNQFQEIPDGSAILFKGVTSWVDDSPVFDWYQYVFILEGDNLVLKKLDITENEGVYYYRLSDITSGVFKIASSGLTSEADAFYANLNTSTISAWYTLTSEGVDVDNFSKFSSSNTGEDSDEIISFFVVLKGTPTTVDLAFRGGIAFGLYC